VVFDSALVHSVVTYLWTLVMGKGKDVRLPELTAIVGLVALPFFIGCFALFIANAVIVGKGLHVLDASRCRSLFTYVEFETACSCLLMIGSLFLAYRACFDLPLRHFSSYIFLLVLAISIVGSMAGGNFVSRTSGHVCGAGLWTVALLDVIIMLFTFSFPAFVLLIVYAYDYVSSQFGWPARETYAAAEDSSLVPEQNSSDVEAEAAAAGVPQAHQVL